MPRKATPKPQNVPTQNVDEDALPSTKTQFPALHGDSEAEVAHRSADGSDGMSYRKTFVLLGSFGPEHPVHADNKARTHEEAIQRGVHPKSEAQLVETKEVPEVRGGVSTELTYAVEVEPASIDTEAAKTATPREMAERVA